MRSTAFDVIGMTVMALVVIFAGGVMFIWGYLRATRLPDNDGARGADRAGSEGAGVAQQRTPSRCCRTTAAQ